MDRKPTSAAQRDGDDEDFVGFATLPEQVHRKAVKRGFDFTLMVVGESGLGKSTLVNSLFLTDLYKDETSLTASGKSGLGKSTLVNSLFLTDLYKDETSLTASETAEQTVHIEEKSLEIVERGVKLRLTIVDTPGFNDSLNGEHSWKSIVEYIDMQFGRYFDDECGVNRKLIIDNRVHCCLYFISPYGHGLRPVDIVAMKNLHKKVNIVPVIAKADCLSKREVKILKDKVIEELSQHEVEVYQFPECDSDEDEEFKVHDKQLKAAFPFAVVGSNAVVDVAGKTIRGRVYPWGIVEVDNPSHCDFAKLRQMLISTHMQDLKDVTADVHYENFRIKHLAAKMHKDSPTEMQTSVEAENLLKEKEAEIERMQSMIARMEQQLSQGSPTSGSQRGPAPTWGTERSVTMGPSRGPPPSGASRSTTIGGNSNRSTNTAVNGFSGY